MMKHSGYFEGILQLRNTGQEVEEFIMNLDEKSKEPLISKRVKVRNGVDLYFISQKSLQSVGKKLKKHFHGEMKISSKLHTRNRVTQKNVYRVNVLFRMHDLKKGDVVVYKGDKIKIIGIGKKILAKDEKTGKKLNFNFKDLS
jgi:NMD protein affecting ribosome stability and mRNA decay|tara:strand:+ start:192 stop:620 length:429 start_codon:yes stop_codon:yes gene_type:complete